MFAEQSRNYMGGIDRQKKKIVLHAIAEYIEGGKEDIYCIDFLEQQGLGVHAFVSPSGLVIKTAQDDALCYHAKGHNAGSLGVEIMVGGCHTYESFRRKLQTNWASDEQYEGVATLVKQWRKDHGIDYWNIYTHAQLDPERKVDTGIGFDYIRVMREVTTSEEQQSPQFKKILQDRSKSRGGV